MSAVDDSRREAAIERYAVIGHSPRADLQALADLAAMIADVPMATVNLITASEQHQVVAHGFEPAICRREDSMCAVTIQLDEPVIVADASLDERFKENPFVSGEIGHVRFYASHQLRTPDGVVFGTLCVFDTVPGEISEERRHALELLAARVVDVLELELSSRELEAANRRLARSNERLGAFAGQVSHDLKNPLAAITMSLEMALDEAEDLTVDEADAVVALLQRASRGAGRMQSMIGDLLAFARGGGRPELEEVDLAAVAAAVQEDLVVVAAEGGQVTVGPLPVLRGDPVQVRALLQNLVANGLTFARPDVPPHVQVSAARVDGRWRVEVEDNGRGIPPESRGDVFEPFTRMDKTVPGTGIGLSTCKRIVEAHGGRIGLETPASGHGTLAWFELPA